MRKKSEDFEKITKNGNHRDAWSTNRRGEDGHLSDYFGAGCSRSKYNALSYARKLWSPYTRSLHKPMVEQNMKELRQVRNILVNQMTVINTQLKEELCMEVERWKQGQLKLSNNKSSENVDPGDLVMLRRSNKLEPPQIGLVLDLTNHTLDASICLQSGYCP